MKRVTILALHLGAGGAERVIVNLSNLLCSFCEVKIISTYKLDDQPAFPIDERVEIEYLMEKELSPNKEELRRAIREHRPVAVLREGCRSIEILYLKKHRMIRAIKSLDTDIAISTRALHSRWLGKYGAAGIVKIAQEHNHHEDNPKIIEQVVQSLENIDYFMPTSRYLAEFYGQILAERKMKTKVQFIQNHLGYFPEETADLKKKNILAVGRLEKEKGFFDFLSIAAQVHRILPDWTFSIVGEGSQYQALQEKIDELELKDVVFLKGLKTGAALEKEYRDSSIYLMTSYQEAFGLVLLEAESYGIPLLAFDSAEGAKEIIEDGQNGFLIPQRNMRDMAAKLIEIARDRELRERIGTEGRKMAQQYSREAVRTEWESFISQIV